MKIKVPALVVTAAVLLGFIMGTVLTGQVQAEPQGLLSQLRVFSQVLRFVKANYVEEVDSEELVQSAIRGLLEDLDPHSTYVEPEAFSRMSERNTGEYEGIGISFEIRDGWITVISAIEGGPSADLGIRPGDQIVEIEGETAKDLANQDVVGKLKGPKGSKVTIGVARPGLDEGLSFTIVRAKIPIHSVPYSFMLDDGKTGYIRLVRFSATTSDELELALEDLEAQGMEQLLFDLRNNSGGFLNQAIEVADKFIDGNEVVVYTKGRIDGSSQYYYSTDSATHPGFPIICLVNHGSASASEIVSGALQDHDRGLVAGVTTFGKGLVQRQYGLGDGSALLLTVARYYTPSGRLIQRPYTDRDEYLEHWRNEAEAEDGAEAAEPDTAGKPLHYTLNKKREVYGGGGIAPDIRLVSDFEATDAQRKIEQTGLFFEFSNELSTRTVARTKPELVEFVRTYEVPDAEVASFKTQALASEGTELTPEELDAEDGYIRRRIKRELAGNLWGLTGRARVVLVDDDVLQAALSHFPEAEMMARVYREANGDR